MNDEIKDGGPSDILYRLYYLCGHIIECVSVFLIYNHFKWNENNDILGWHGETRHIHMGYNKRFTIDSHMDYYPLSVDSQSKKIQCKSKYRAFDLGSAEASEIFYNVHSHCFQDYIKGIIWAQLPQNVPYLRPPCPEDVEYENAIELIENWTTDLRYYYEGRKSGSFVKHHASLPHGLTVTVQKISELFMLCEKIIKIIPSGRSL